MSVTKAMGSVDIPDWPLILRVISLGIEVTLPYLQHLSGDIAAVFAY
jgi:hypothetical protein